MSRLRTQVLEKLRCEILDQHLKPGDILLEKEVAARLKVSKTPVREALAVLCQEGLVQLFPRRGYLVRGLSIQDVVDTFDLRLILEGAACERAAKNMKPEETVVLEELSKHDCCGELDKSVSWHLEAMRHSFDFHIAIACGSGNRRLATEIEKLLRESRRITSIGFVYGQHSNIVEAIKSRDGAAARKVMEDHIRSGREAAVRALMGSSET